MIISDDQTRMIIHGFGSIFCYDLEEKKEIDLDQLQIKSFYIPQQLGQADIAWEIAESEKQIFFNLKYRTDIFDRETIVRMEGHIRQIIATVLANPQVKLSEIELLTPLEKESILTSKNGIEIDLDSIKGFTIPSYFEQQVAKTPNNVAVELNEESITYDELNRRANQLAAFFRTKGVCAEQVVGLMLNRSIDMVVTILAIQKAGGAFVPIDPKLPDDRKKYMLTNSCCTSCIITSDMPSLNLSSCAFISIDHLNLTEYPDVNCAACSTPNNLAYIIYTSGSTGQPKGVMLEHTGFINMILDQISTFETTGNDIVLQFASFSFDASLYEIFIALFSGAKLVMVTPEVLRDIPTFHRYIIDKKVTIMVLPPVFLKDLDDTKLGSVRTIITAGESPIYKDIERLRTKICYVNAYGPTENSVCSSRYNIDSENPLPDTIPIGKPIANTRIYIFDSNQNLCPIGVQGEIYTAGIGVARGYINNPELTAEKFLADPYFLGERMYRTGDLGKWLPDGTIEFCGRIDHQIKISGYRVELGEIEGQLMSIPQVSQAVVIDCVNPQGTRYLSSFLICSSNTSEAQIKVELAKSLPYYMVPARFHFLTEFSITSNGKIDRKALLQIEKESFVSTKETSVTKRTGSQTELILTEIWKSILGLETCDRGKNFFDLGGHSLLVVELQNQICREFQIDLPITDLFTYSSIETQSEQIDSILNPKDLKSAKEQNEEGSSQRPKNDDIAIIGMAGRFPGASNIDEFWGNLVSGTESISTFSKAELLENGVSEELIGDSNYIPAKGFLKDADLFDATQFEMNPRDAELTDPQQRVFLEIAHTVFEHAGYDYTRITSPVGVFASTGFSTYLQHNIGVSASSQDRDFHQIMIGNDKDFIATRVSYKLNLTGPSQTIQTACSSSLVNVHYACDSLKSHSCDMAIAGGVNITLPLKSGYLYTQDGIVSPNGQCRPFDSKANGTVPGNGAAVVLLKRLKDAQQDGDTIYAVIKGSAVNNDGSGKIGFTAPSVSGQKSVMKQALNKAGFAPETVGFIEAHGTGTNLGDPIEFKALSEVYGKNRTFPCAIGAVKGNIGHLDSAAGVTGLIKTALSLYHKTIVPTVHFKEPNKALQMDERSLYIANRSHDWESHESRRAAVSSLGLGGTNAHVILEESPKSIDMSSPLRQFHLLPLSAPSPLQLDILQTNIRSDLSSRSTSLHNFSYTLCTGRTEYRQRSIAIVGPDTDIATFEWLSPSTHLDKPQMVWLFPGQGSQYLNMGRELYRSETLFRVKMSECAEKLKSLLGIDILGILFPDAANELDAEERIHETELSQPILFALSYSLAELWKSWGIVPDKIIGHSFGEFAGAVTAGVFSLDDALLLISKRAELIQSMPKGGMLSVLASASRIISLLDDTLSISAYNFSENCVVSGPIQSINALSNELKTLKIQSLPLAVSHGFHSPMMKDAATGFLEIIQTIPLRAPEIPIFSTVTGKLISSEEITNPEYWCRQITDPVRFSDAVAAVLTEDTVFLEVGASETLCRLIRAGGYKKRFECVSSLPHRRMGESDTRTMMTSFGMLWCFGIAVNLGILFKKEQHKRVSVPTLPFNKTRFWLKPVAQTTQSLDKRSDDPKEWIYATKWIPSIPPNRDWRFELNRCSITWLLFLDEIGLGRNLAAMLRSTGQKVITVQFSEYCPEETDDLYDSDSFVINHTKKEEYDSLFKELTERRNLPDRIIHLSMLTCDRFREFDEKNLEALNYLGFFSLLFITKALQHNAIDKKMEFSVISDHIFSVNGEDWINPLKATVQGPITVIPQEHRNIVLQHIDVSLDSTDKEIRWLADFLIQDIIDFTPNETLAYRNHRRWTKGYEKQTVSPGKMNFKKHGVYLITGGMGGIGLSIAREFANGVSTTLVLLGRTLLPPRKTWKKIIDRNDSLDKSIIQRLETIIEIEEMGCRVVLVSADLTNCEGLNSSLRKVEEKTGKIQGVIHAAGTAGGNLISTKTTQDVEQIFLPKIQGTMNLERYFKDRNLDFFLLFSSLNAITGGIGQVAYSGANAFLDALAAHNFSDRHLNTLSINWTGWKNTGMIHQWKNDDSMKKLQEKYLSNSISVDEGIETLKLCLSLGPTYRLIISPKEFNSWRSTLLTIDVDSSMKKQKQRYDRPPLATSLVAARSSEEQCIVELWESVLNISPIGIDDNFFDLGGHSLMGLEVLSRISEQMKLSLQLNHLYDYPTIRLFSDQLQDRSLLNPFSEFHMEKNEESNSTLVTQFQKGTGSKKLFLFQPLGVNVFYYKMLVKYLDPSFSVYGLRTAEVEGSKALPQTIEEIARACTKIIQQIDPSGEYYLAGASLGGVVAFETAQQLKELGKVIKLLSLFDSPGPNHHSKFPETDAELFHHLFNDWQSLSLQTLQDLKTLDEQANYIIQRFKEEKQSSYEINHEQVILLLELAKASFKALTTYFPKEYDGDILFLKPLEMSTIHDNNAEQVWKKVAPKRVEIHNVPGDHRSMNFDPNVESIALILNSRLLR